MNKSEIYHVICGHVELKNFTLGKKYFLHIVNGIFIKLMNDKKEWVDYDTIRNYGYTFSPIFTHVIFKKDIGNYSKNQKANVWISINKEKFIPHFTTLKTEDCKKYLKILEE